MLHETIDQAVKNLEMISEAFEKVANDPKYYNTDFAYYLEQFSYDLYKDAREIKERRLLLGEF